MAVKCIINKVRFSYVHVFQPHKFEGDGDDKEPKYSVTVLIPKKDKESVAQVQQAIKEAYNQAKTEKWAGKSPVKWFNPLQDGDEPTADGDSRGEAYEGCYYINAKSVKQPGIVDKNRQPILQQDEFYSGCYGAVSVSFAGFDNNGNKGISAFLNNVMKTKDGEPLGNGASSPEEDFADIEVDDDDL